MSGSTPPYTIEGQEIHDLKPGRAITKDTAFAGDTPGGLGRFMTEQFDGQQLIEFFQQHSGEILTGALSNALQDTDTYFYAPVYKDGIVNIDDIFGSVHAIRPYKLIGLSAFAEEGPNGNNADGFIQFEVYDYEAQEALTDEVLEIDFTDNKVFKRFNAPPTLSKDLKYGVRVKDLNTADDIQNVTIHFVLQIINPQPDPYSFGIFNPLALAPSNFCADRAPTDEEPGDYTVGSIWVDTTGSDKLNMDVVHCPSEEEAEGCEESCLDCGVSPLVTSKTYWNAMRCPRETDDELDGFCPGSTWLDQTDCSFWFMVSNTFNDAKWIRLDDQHISKFAKAKSNLDADAPPTPDNDETEGYCPGSMWISEGGGSGCPLGAWIAVDVTAASAVWVRIDNDTVASAPSNYTATTNPTPSDNASPPGCYAIGSQWYNTVTGNLFILTSFSGVNAVWTSMTDSLWQTDTTTLSPKGGETVVEIEELRSPTAVLNVDESSFTKQGVEIATTSASNGYTTKMNGTELVDADIIRALQHTGEPGNPPDDEWVVWMDDGSRSTTGEDTTGDIFVKVTIGGTTKIGKLFDWSAATTV
jgi:hypothetical protein